MDLKEVRYIVSIAHNRSITKAAEELFITQPSLSKYLQSIEKQLGVPLFQRFQNQYTPTYVGERYLNYAEQILCLRNDWELESQKLINKGYGKLQIAIPVTRSYTLIPNVLPAFLEKYPNVNIILREQSYEISDSFILHNDIDFALYNVEPNLPTVQCQFLGEEDCVLVCSENHSLCSQFQDGIITELSALSELQFVFFDSQQNLGAIIDEFIKAHDIHLIPFIRTRNPELAFALAEKLGTVTFAPVSYVQKFQKQHNLAYFRIASEIIKLPLFAVYRKGRYMPDYGTYFLSLIRQMMGSLE